MTIKLFPTHFRLILDEKDRWALQTLFQLDPHLIDELELLHKVIRRGIAEMEREAKENYDPHDPTPLPREAKPTTTGLWRKAQLRMLLRRVG